MEVAKLIDKEGGGRAAHVPGFVVRGRGGYGDGLGLGDVSGCCENPGTYIVVFGRVTAFVVERDRYEFVTRVPLPFSNELPVYEFEGGGRVGIAYVRHFPVGEVCEGVVGKAAVRVQVRGALVNLLVQDRLEWGGRTTSQGRRVGIGTRIGCRDGEIRWA